jgi:PII-like signaling protein
VQFIPTSALSPLGFFQSGEAMDVTVYFDSLRLGEIESFSESLTDEYANRGVRVSHRLSAASSFGRSRRIRTDISAEVDPPLVVFAVDTSPSLRSAIGSCSSLVGEMLVTVASTEIVLGTAEALRALGSEPAALVVHCRRGRSHDDPHGVSGVLEHLRRHGVAGGTALGHGEGTIVGHRHRPRLLSRSPEGPMMVVSIDQADVLAGTAPSLLELPQVELMTAKPVFLCKWRGRRRSPPAPTPEHPPWSLITVYTGGESPLGWRPKHLALIQRLRKLGAPGATTVRGTQGYALSDPLRPDRGWFGRRTAPTVTTIIDTPDHAAQWLRTVDEVMEDDGLVTHEFVSAHRLM